MTADTRDLESWFADLADRLALEFDGVVAPDVVTATALTAKLDLAGQIVPEAQNEMVYRLARYRLDQLSCVRGRG